MAAPVNNLEGHRLLPYCIMRCADGRSVDRVQLLLLSVRVKVAHESSVHLLGALLGCINPFIQLLVSAHPFPPGSRKLLELLFSLLLCFQCGRSWVFATVSVWYRCSPGEHSLSAHWLCWLIAENFLTWSTQPGISWPRLSPCPLRCTRPCKYQLLNATSRFQFIIQASVYFVYTAHSQEFWLLDIFMGNWRTASFRKLHLLLECWLHNLFLLRPWIDKKIG